MSEFWNDDWRTELKEKNYDCWERLAECRNTLKDVKLMAKLMYQYNPNQEAEDCLTRMLEWVCDWNNQYNIDPTREEFDEMVKYIKGEK